MPCPWRATAQYRAPTGHGARGGIRLYQPRPDPTLCRADVLLGQRLRHRPNVPCCRRVAAVEGIPDLMYPLIFTRCRTPGRRIGFGAGVLRIARRAAAAVPRACWG